MGRRTQGRRLGAIIHRTEQKTVLHGQAGVSAQHAHLELVLLKVKQAQALHLRLRRLDSAWEHLVLDAVALKTVDLGRSMSRHTPR